MSSKSSLASLASSRLNKRRRERKGSSNGLLDFQVELNPNYTRADHLGEMVERLETCINEPLRLILSAPPRHGKTQLILTLIVMYLKAHPDKLVAYCTYSSQLAESNSRQIRQMAKAAGLQFSDSSKAAHEWRLAQGGGLIAVGVSGPLTGYGISLLVVDDPHRSRAEAESPKIRQNVFEWWTSTAMSRLEPGASAIVTHTRWHQDDLTGTLLKESAADWQYVNLKAISDDGKPLWPLRYDLAALEKRRKDVGEYEWAALYMGDPRPKGGAVFKNTNVYLQADDIRWLIEHAATDRCKCASCCGYRKLPIAFKRIAIGLDLAYTEDTYADYSVAIVLGLGTDNRFYVLDCVRAQCELPTFIQKLKLLRQTYTDAKMFWYTGGQEKEIARQIKASGLPIQTEKAVADKFVRAQDVAAAWNDNMILVPEGGEKYPWVNKFLSEVLSFTGIGDTHDDDVDALAAAYMRLKVHTGGVRRTGTNRVLPF